MNFTALEWSMMSVYFVFVLGIGFALKRYLIWGVVLLLLGGLMWSLGARTPNGTATKLLGEANGEPRSGQ